jgi:hypothetical protein
LNNERIVNIDRNFNISERKALMNLNLTVTNAIHRKLTLTLNIMNITRSHGLYIWQLVNPYYICNKNVEKDFTTHDAFLH